MIIDKALERLQIAELNKMQLRVMDTCKTKNNVLLLSPTGSGKTLAFLLPILQQLKPVTNAVQALIVVPSRELALQIEQVFKQATNEFKITCCYGGHATRTELNSLLEAPAVIVGTPGRIAFHLDRGNFDESSVTTVVLDEFDKSLEFGFQDDMSYIVKSLKSLQKRFLTSATDLVSLPSFIQSNNYQRIDFLSDQQVKPDFSLKAIETTEENKLSTLFKLVCKLGNQASIIFVNFRETTEQVADLLKGRGIDAQIYHGGLEQDDRERALLKFRNRSSNILITTDLGARGLDIQEVQNIIHFQLPKTEDAFIHRNGRTARMNAKGTIYIFNEGNKSEPYLKNDLGKEKLDGKYELPLQPEWETLYLSLGKKDKINKVDVVGFLAKTGDLQKEDIGLIEVKDKAVFVAVKRKLINKLAHKLANQKMKGKKVKIEVAD
jgi:ATP-independent RNA helicase DbpA